LIIKSISDRWYFIIRRRCISKDEFLKALRLVLESFIFDDNIYNQKFGTPMSSPLSPIIADLVIEDLECRMLERFRTEVPFYFRYVDDIAIAIPNHLIEEFLGVCNFFHSRL